MRQIDQVGAFAGELRARNSSRHHFLWESCGASLASRAGASGRTIRGMSVIATLDLEPQHQTRNPGWGGVSGGGGMREGILA